MCTIATNFKRKTLLILYTSIFKGNVSLTQRSNDYMASPKTVKNCPNMIILINSYGRNKKCAPLLKLPVSVVGSVRGNGSKVRPRAETSYRKSFAKKCLTAPPTPLVLLGWGMWHRTGSQAFSLVRLFLKTYVC